MKTISLLLLPGLDGTGNLFAPLINHLPDWIKPIVVSYPKDTPCGYDALLTIVTSAYPKDKNFVILGESFSGPLAVMTAVEKPEGLKGVILSASFVKNPLRFIPSWSSIFSVGPAYYLWPAAIKLQSFLGIWKHEWLVEMALDAIKSVHPNVIATRVREILNVNVELDLSKIDIPMLYLQGLRDHLVRKHNVAGIKKIKKDLIVTEIDTQHFILQLEPERSAGEIERFMKSLGQPSDINL